MRLPEPIYVFTHVGRDTSHNLTEIAPLYNSFTLDWNKKGNIAHDFYLHDRLGSVRRITDSSAGVVMKAITTFTEDGKHMSYTGPRWK